MGTRLDTAKGAELDELGKTIGRQRLSISFGTTVNSVAAIAGEPQIDDAYRARLRDVWPRDRTNRLLYVGDRIRLDDLTAGPIREFRQWGRYWVAILHNDRYVYTHLARCDTEEHEDAPVTEASKPPAPPPPDAHAEKKVWERMRHDRLTRWQEELNWLTSKLPAGWRMIFDTRGHFSHPIAVVIEPSGKEWTVFEDNPTGDDLILILRRHIELTEAARARKKR